MKVSFDDLESAFYGGNDESSFWIDKKNGKVIFIADESVVGEIEYANEDEAEAVYEIKVLCGEFETEEINEIDENRYVEFFPPDSNEKWKWMEEFTVEAVENPEIQHKLADALRGGKPFRRFKDALRNYPNVKRQWFDFENFKCREYAEKWAENESLEIDFDGKKE